MNIVLLTLAAEVFLKRKKKTLGSNINLLISNMENFISYVNVFCIDILKVYLNVLIEKIFMSL